jgi:hypothetical protein
MTAEQVESPSLLGRIESSGGDLIHGVMDDVKSNFNTLTNRHAGAGEVALAGLIHELQRQ